MRKEKYIIALDVGGTSLETAIVSSRGYIVRNSFKTVPINSRGSAELILGTYVKALNSLLNVIIGSDLNLNR